MIIKIINNRKYILNKTLSSTEQKSVEILAQKFRLNNYSMARVVKENGIFQIYLAKPTSPKKRFSLQSSNFKTAKATIKLTNENELNHAIKHNLPFYEYIISDTCIAEKNMTKSLQKNYFSFMTKSIYLNTMK